MLKKFILNAKLRGKVSGTILSLDVDRDGIPLDRYWRARLTEAANNNCMSRYVAVNEQKIKKTTKAPFAKGKKFVKESMKKKEDNS